MQHLEVYVNANGREGYTVGWRPTNGMGKPEGPPIPLASFASGKEGRREALMFKNGLLAGVRLSATLLQRIVRDVGDDL